MGIYKYHNYLNKDIVLLVNREITEYDMESAGFNIIKNFNLLPLEEIYKLEKMDKKSRHIEIGMIQKQNKELVSKMSEMFIYLRKKFIEENKLNDEDILSIKKDAIITLKRCKNTYIEGITFREKNIYSSYYYINKYEFYYNKTQLHVKGINDEKLKLHENYMLEFIKTYAKMNEISPKKRTVKFVVDFSKFYKNKQLEIGFYRELNNQSLYRLKDVYFDGEFIGVENIKDKNYVDISYNYLNYIVPLSSLLI
ncbi:MAG: hypothetical protein ACK4F9_06920 [Brevinematia bacterium]